MAVIEDFTVHNAELAQLRKDIWELVQKDLGNADDRATKQETIYHYTDVRSALEILKSGHLWFTERAHLNDTLEVQYALKVATDMLGDAARAAGPGVPSQIAEHLWGEFNAGLTEFGYWVASFSFENDDLSQWRSYADDGRGVCLGFSVQCLDMSQFAAPLPRNSNFLRFPVEYDEAVMRASLSQYIDLAVKLPQKVNLVSMAGYTQP